MTTTTAPRPSDRSARPATASRADLLRPLATVIAEVGGSLAAFYLARTLGAGELAAYLWACLPPSIAALVGVVRMRRLDAASVAIVGFNLLSAAFVGIGSHSPTALLYKDCVVTALVGLTFLVSIGVGKPLTHMFALRFRENDREQLERLWAGQPRYRAVQRRICAVWGTTFVVEAAVKAVIVANLSFDAAFGVSQLLPFAAFGLAMVYTVHAGRAARREGDRLRAQ